MPDDSNKCPHCGRTIPPDAPGGICPVCLLSEAAAPSGKAPWSSTGRDTNLLFALFAYLLNYLDSEKFAEVLRDWATNPSVSIADRLAASGDLSEASRNYVEGLLARALEHYEGNASRTLDSLGGHSRVASILRGTADRAMQDLIETKLALRVTEDFLEAEPSVENSVAEKPGRYTGSSEYSRGGMGRILLVHDELLARDIALKELLPSPDEYVGSAGPEQSPMRASAALLARFLREARITGRLEHPSIVPVYELGRRPNGRLYYTMRLVRGKTLRTVLQECTTLEDRLKLLSNFIDLCMGIAYAHSKGVIHRDIKPSNIMIGEFGETVIIDWGLAKVVNGEERIDDTLHRLHGGEALSPDKTATGEILGSPHYMSPEQAAGEADETDARSDVFSLGVLLYEILTNRPAFEGKSLEALVYQIQFENPVPISEHEPHVPSELASICERAMEKDKNRRYSSAKELGEDVNRFLAGSLVSVYSYTPFERFRRFYRRHSAILNTVVAAILIVVATVVIAIVRISQSRDEALVARDNEAVAREEAQSSRYNAEIRLAQSYLEANNPEAANETLWKIEPARRNWEWGFLLNRSRPEIVRLNGFYLARMSPAGDRFAAASQSHPLTLFSYPDGQVLREIADTRALIASLAFSPDGSMILAGLRNNRARLWDTETGLLLHEFGGHFLPVHSVYFSPTTDRAVTVSFDNSVQIWDVASGENVARLRPGRRGLSGAVIDPQGERLALWFMDDPQGGLEVQVWEMETGERLWSAVGNRPVFGRDGSRVYYLDGLDVVIADSASGNEIYRLRDHDSRVMLVAITPDGTRAVSAASDGQLIVWDLFANSPQTRIVGPRKIERIAIESSGERFATTSLDSRVRVWRLTNPTPELILPGHNHFISVLEFIDGEALLTSSVDNTVRAWDARTAAGIARRSDTELVGDIDVAVPAELVSVARSGKATVFEGGTLRFIEEFVCPGSVGAGHVGIAPDGNLIALMLDGFSTIVWDRSAGRLTRALQGQTGLITAMMFDTENETVLTGGWDGTIHIAEIETDGPIAEVNVADAPIDALDFDEAESLAVLGDRNGFIHLVDTRANTVLRSLQTQEAPVTALTLAPDRTRLALSAGDGTVSLLRWPSLEVLAEMQGHTDIVSDVAFSVDGTRLASASTDRTMRIWDAASGRELISLANDAMLGAAAWDDESCYGGDRERGALIAWQAAPYSPLSDTEAERERFRRYRLERRQPQTPPPSPMRRTVFLSDTAARQHVTALATSLESPSAASGTVNQPGLPVPRDLSRVTLSALYLGEDDAILRVNGAQIGDTASAAEQWNRIASELEQGSASSFSVELRSSGEYWRVHYQVIPVLETETTIRLPRERMIETLDRVLEALRVGAGAMEQRTIEIATEHGLDATADSMPGIYVSYEESILARSDYLSLGIARDDRVLELDGIAVTTVPGFTERFEAIANEVRSGDRSSFSMAIERGPFRKVDLTIAAE